MVKRVFLFASVASMTALVLGGCSGASAGSTGSAATTAPSASATQAAPPATQATAPTPAPTHAAPALKFPNKTVNVVLVGYNSSVHMVQFRQAVFQQEPDDGGAYVPDLADPSIYQLPLAANATVFSAVVFCPSPNGTPTFGPGGVGNGPCTVPQFLDALQGHSPLGSAVGEAAQIVVDGTDHISKVSEIYHP